MAVAIFVSIVAIAAEPQELRVAAIMFSDQDPKALIEDSNGVQEWYEIGEFLGATEIVDISVDSVTVTDSGNSSMLMLRGAKRVSLARLEEPPAPAAEASKDFRFGALLSEIEAAKPLQGESQADADKRTMNRVLGLADKARITAVGRVEVSTAAEARAELQQRLVTNDDPIRIMIDGDVLEMLYVVPEH